MRCYDFSRAVAAVDGTDKAQQAIAATGWGQCARDGVCYVVNSATAGNLHDIDKKIVFKAGFADGAPSLGLCAQCLYNFLNVLEPVGIVVTCPIKPDRVPTSAADICTYKHDSEIVTIYDPAKFTATVNDGIAKNLSGYNIWQDDVVFVPENTRQQVASGAAKYLLITPPLNQNRATGELFPSSFAPNEQFVLSLQQLKPDVTLRTFTMPGTTGRTLDLVVASGGHGGIGRLFANEYTTQYVDSNVIGPLATKGYKADIIVLDACLTASMIPGFKKLLSSGGTIYCTMYSTTTRIASPDVWQSIKPVLAGRASGYQTKLKTILEQRMKDINHGLEATAYLEDIRSGRETYVEDLLKQAPGAKEHISIARYLGKMIDARDEYARTQNPSDLQSLATNVNVAPADKDPVAEILSGSDDPAKKAAALEAALKKRVIEVLTDPKYGSLEKVSDLANRPLSGHDSLSTVLARDAERILALAPLPPLPTQFAIYTQTDETLKYDELIDSDAQIEKLKAHTGDETPEEIRRLQSVLKKEVSWSPQVSFLR